MKNQDTWELAPFAPTQTVLTSVRKHRTISTKALLIFLLVEVTIWWLLK